MWPRSCRASRNISPVALRATQHAERLALRSLAAALAYGTVADHAEVSPESVDSAARTSVPRHGLMETHYHRATGTATLNPQVAQDFGGDSTPGMLPSGVDRSQGGR
jgi:hypothetical protein